MNFISDYLPVMYSFRHFYQGSEVIVGIAQDNGNRAQQAFLINKLTIEILDCLSTYYLINLRLANPQNLVVNGFLLAEAGCRLIDIGRGLYLLRTNPNHDKLLEAAHMILNCLNVSRLALVILNPLERTYKLYPFLCCLDASLRICLLLRPKMIDKTIHTIIRIFNFFRNIDRDYVMRAICQAGLSVLALLQGIYFLGKGVQFIHDKDHAFTLGTQGVLIYFSAPLIKMAVHKIFDDLGYLASTKRELMEWSFSVISAATLSAAATVGLGLNRSMLHGLGNSFLVFAVSAGFLLSLGSFGLSGFVMLPLANGREPISWDNLRRLTDIVFRNMQPI